MKNQLFSERYADIVDNKDFESMFDLKFCRAMFDALIKFNESSKVPVSRYDSLTEVRCAQDEAYEDLIECGRYGISSANEITFERSAKQRYTIWLDLIEAWYSHLSDGEKSPFQVEVNGVFHDYNQPWRLVEGKIVRMDSRQFERDLKIKYASLLDGVSVLQPVFNSALTEYRDAIEAFAKNDYKDAVLNAERSYESVLKIVCGEGTGTANKLKEAYLASKYIEDVPENVRGGFGAQVLMSLPFIRNNLNVGHGNGLNNVKISKELANLSLNLCAALCTYIIDVYGNYVNKPSGGETEIVGDEESDDLPF